MNGLVVVDKPLGMTSAQVVRRVKGAAGGVKTGHAGTLDPLATGVLICCVGSATKAVEKLMGLTKVYEATVDLSAFTATDDREAPPQPVTVERPPGVEALREALTKLTGAIQQAPPAYSAVHTGGRRAYELARRGEEVSVPARAVRVEAIELLGYEWPVARLRITCGRGTYIRSLARDLGKALGTGGHLAELRRTAVGPYDVGSAVSVERLAKGLTQADLLAPPG